MPERTDIRPGDRVRVELPFSEVCMHMRIAGQVREVELVKHPRPTTSEPDRASFEAKIFLDRGHTSVLPAEAGILSDAGAFYAYEVPA